MGWRVCGIFFKKKFRQTTSSHDYDAPLFSAYNRMTAKRSLLARAADTRPIPVKLYPILTLQIIIIIIYCVIKRCADLQTSGETGGFVLDHRRFWWFAHYDQLLVGHHDDAGELRKPHSDVHETLKNTRTANEILKRRRYVL